MHARPCNNEMGLCALKTPPTTAPESRTNATDPEERVTQGQRHTSSVARATAKTPSRREFIGTTEKETRTNARDLALHDLAHRAAITKRLVGVNGGDRELARRRLCVMRMGVGLALGGRPAPLPDLVGN